MDKHMRGRHTALAYVVAEPVVNSSRSAAISSARMAACTASPDCARGHDESEPARTQASGECKTGLEAGPCGLRSLPARVTRQDCVLAPSQVLSECTGREHLQAGASRSEPLPYHRGTRAKLLVGPLQLLFVRPRGLGAARRRRVKSSLRQDRITRSSYSSPGSRHPAS